MNTKKVTRCIGAACAATGIVAMSGLVASGAAVGAVVEGFKSAASTMKRMLEETQPETETIVLAEPVTESLQETAEHVEEQIQEN